MKTLKTICRLMLVSIVCSLSLPAFSQGVAIYKKDGSMVKYAYEEIDSIVTYNYGEEPGTPSIPDTPVASQYEAVDLGLSVKWATHNVGATKPEEYGGYYAWGETEEKDNYSWSTYKWCKGSSSTMTKYCTNSSDGAVDGKTVLDPEDDVAHVKWGGDWRMPTKAELDELLTKCTLEWTSLNGVLGYKVTGPNGNSIFLPSAGYRFATDVYHGVRYDGYCWSSSLGSRSCDAGYLGFGDRYTVWADSNRYYGLSVRPVLK